MHHPTYGVQLIKAVLNIVPPCMVVLCKMSLSPFAVAPWGGRIWGSCGCSDVRGGCGCFQVLCSSVPSPGCVAE